MRWLKKNAWLVFWILHTVGLFGFAFAQDLFLHITPYHLWTITLLLFWGGMPAKKSPVLISVFVLFTLGMLAEIIGVNTAYLFGNYAYSDILGLQILGVPLVIGLNWATLVYCAYSITFSDKISAILSASTAALMITLFDFALEPVAISFNWWQWLDTGDVPVWNYITWFVLVFIMVMTLNYKRIPQLPRSLSLHFIFAQVVFFILVRYIV